MTSRRDLTNQGILRSLGQLATPMLITAVLQNVQSLIDLFWVGRLGSLSVAAIAMSGTVLMLLFPMLMGLSTGTTALVSRAVGGARQRDANAAAAQSLILALALGLISGVVGWLFCDQLLDLLGADPAVAVEGGSYLRISLAGSFTVFVLFIGNAALQASGDALTPMWIMAASNGINIVLDPLFIFGVGPIGGMGVRGAALATVIAQAVAAFLSIRILLSGRRYLHLRSWQWRPDVAMMWRILRIGIYGSAQMLTRSFMNAVMMRIVAGCGVVAVAAYGIGLRLHMIILMPAFALGGAAATMVGQNLGAAKPQRASAAAWIATAVDAAFMAFTALIIAVFAPTVVHAFNPEADVVQTGADYLRTVSPFYVFSALGIVLGRALNGAGDAAGPMIITIVTLCGLQIPAAVLFSRLTEPPTQGIWWAMAITFVVHGLLVAGWFSTGRWKHKHV